MILDSRDRRARPHPSGSCSGWRGGLLIVVVAFQFFSWLVPDKAAAGLGDGGEVPGGAGRNRPMADVALGRTDPENTILKRYSRRTRPDDEQTDTDPAATAAGDGYSKPAAATALKKLIEKPGGTFDTRPKERRDGLQTKPLPMPPHKSDLNPGPIDLDDNLNDGHAARGVRRIRHFSGIRKAAAITAHSGCTPCSTAARRAAGNRFPSDGSRFHSEKKAARSGRRHLLPPRG